MVLRKNVFEKSLFSRGVGPGLVISSGSADSSCLLNHCLERMEPQQEFNIFHRNNGKIS